MKAGGQGAVPGVVDPFRQSLAERVTQHETMISNLGTRMTGVESGLKTLQGEVHHGFDGVQKTMHGLGSGLAALTSKLDSQPRLDLHKVITSVASLTVMFGLVCTGIIYISGAQFSGLIAKQEAMNGHLVKSLDRHQSRLDHHDMRLGRIDETLGQWRTQVREARR